MPRLLNLPAALKKFGCEVEVVPGWERRGDSLFSPRCTVGHHTAGPRNGDRPSLRVVVEGRPGLPGPLAQDFLTRSGVVVVVAAGRANHAGVGGFRGLRGNSSAMGNEAESSGRGDWTPEQLEALPRLHAAHLWLMGQDASWYCSHRTWAEPPGRKIDPVAILDSWMRTGIARVMDEVLNPKPPEEDEMKMILAQTENDDAQWLIMGGWKIHIRQRGVYEWLLKCANDPDDNRVENWGQVPAGVLNHIATRTWSPEGFPVDSGQAALEAVLRVSQQLESLARTTSDDATVQDVSKAVTDLNATIAGMKIVP